MLLQIFLFAFSGAGILAVARFGLYDPAQRISRSLRLSPHATGQLLGYLTSAPELIATVFIAATGLFTVVAVNVAGSNIINVFLASVAVLWYSQTRAVISKEFRREHAIIATTVIAPLILMAFGIEDLWITAAFMVVAYGFYVFFNRSAPGQEVVLEELSGDDSEPERGRDPGEKRWKVVAVNGMIAAVSLGFLYILGDVLGGATESLAVQFAVPAVVLGIVTAVATSLPEFATFFSSFMQRPPGEAVKEVIHNVMASNVSNLLIVQSVGIAVFQLAA